LPDESDVSARLSAVPVFVRSTVAPGIVPPLGSVTVPTIEPNELWAMLGKLANASNNSSDRRPEGPVRRIDLIDSLPSYEA
jgi:hypothetical protein